MKDEINLNGVVYTRKDLGSEPKLLPFDIDKAKAGAKVVTRDEREVVIYDFDYKSSTGYRIAGKLIEAFGGEELNSWTEAGYFLRSQKVNNKNLFLLNPKGQ